MVAKLSAGNAASLADYYLKQTQPDDERNQDLEYQLKPVPDWSGTVPVFQRDMAPQTMQAFRLDMAQMQADPHAPMRHLFAGLRADGGPTGKRGMAAYTRQDGKEFAPKAFYDVTISNHISVGIALYNAETPAGRALILGAALEANAYAVAGMVAHMGYVRRGAGGSGGMVSAYPLVVSFPHFATRPTQSGFVAPNLHFHNVIFSAAPDANGRMGAIDPMRFAAKQVTQIKFNYHNRFADNIRQLNIDYYIDQSGSVILRAVPENLSEFFAQRRQEIIERARENAQRKGIDFDRLGPAQQEKYKVIAARQTRGQSHDGMTDAPQWRWHCARLDYTARDLPRLFANGMLAMVESHAQQQRQRPSSLRAPSLADSYQQTYQQTRQAAQQGALQPRTRRQIIAATLALRLAMAQPKPKPNLVQQFAMLAEQYTVQKSTIRQSLLARKLVPSLTPALMELQRMAAMQTQPLQKDIDSLGQYLVQKHRLPSEMAPQIPAGASLALSGRMTMTEVTTTIMRTSDRERMLERITSAVSDAAGFFDGAKLGRNFVAIGDTQNGRPIIFAASYGDAALVRDATGGKLAVVTGYTPENTLAVMREWRTNEPTRQFIYSTDKANEPAAVALKTQLGNTAVIVPPPNASNSHDWQTYAKNYGTEAVTSNMRQAFRQEFSQSMRQTSGLKITQAPE